VRKKDIPRSAFALEMTIVSSSAIVMGTKE
jgi:hypothetical protein